jgi:hypothetical protein
MNSVENEINMKKFLKEVDIEKFFLLENILSNMH